MRKLALWVVGLALAVFIARQFLHPERDASWVARPTAPETLKPPLSPSNAGS